jgi:hypothetical protein
MNIDELKEQVQQNLWKYIDSLSIKDFDTERVLVRDDVLDIVENTFSNAFHAPAPKVGA